MKGLKNVFPDEVFLTRGRFRWKYFYMEAHIEQLFENRNSSSAASIRPFRVSGDYIQVVPVISSSGKSEGQFPLPINSSLFAANKDKSVAVHDAADHSAVPIYLCHCVYDLIFPGIYKSYYPPIETFDGGFTSDQEKNLDFHIDYHADNELGNCAVFSDMKEELRSPCLCSGNWNRNVWRWSKPWHMTWKSPLSVIKAYSEAVLDDTEVDEEQRQYLAVIEENIEKSISLVQQMQYTPTSITPASPWRKYA